MKIPNYIKVSTPTCIVCGRPGEMTVEADAYHRWQNGAYVQDAFRHLSPDAREMLLTGTHPECWNRMFPDEEDQ